MASAKIEKIQKKDMPEEGTTYYYSPAGSFKAPAIAVDSIGKILDNKVISEGLTQQQLAIFEKPIEVSAENIKKGEIDPDLTSSLNDMVHEDLVSIDAFAQRAWRDVAEWGIALTNPVWDYPKNSSEFRLLKLKRLKPFSFGKRGASSAYVFNRLLPGILLNDKTQELEYWQIPAKSGSPVQLQNVEILTDPTSDVFDAAPSIVPIYPYVKMLTFSWARQMQKVNQYGSGGIWFLKVTDPTGDDKKFAQNIVNNASSINRYQLRPNMTIENLGISENGSALETITQIGMEIKKFFSPAGLIQKDSSSTIGGSSSPELILYQSFIAAKRTNIQDYIRRLLNPWLVWNGYNKDGKPKEYRIIVKLPGAEIDKSELYLKIHDSGSNQGSLLPNEKRALLRAALPQQAGIDISDLDPVGLSELAAYRETTKAPMPFNAQLQKAETVAKVMAASPDNPLINRGKAKKIIQAQLGIEEGSDDDDDAPMQSDAIGAINRLTKATQELVKVSKEG